MTTFVKAKRENVNLLVGLVGGTGGGKTKSGFELAKGICGDKPFAVIDTEARRALHYADSYNFDHAELLPPFTPDRYLDAILSAEKAGYKAIVIDSMSHEHEGEGGLLDMQEAELQRMAGNDYNKRQQCLQASWIAPKRSHKKMVQRLLQVRAHLIICMRAEDKTELKKVEGKLVMVPKASLTGINGWIPICEKRLPFELTASFLLTADAPGIPKPIKLQDQHRTLFPLDKPITEQSGKQLNAWATGASGTKPPAQDAASDSNTSKGGNPARPESDAATMTEFDKLLVKAQEMAESGTVKYADWWANLLSKKQRQDIGEERHTKFKAIAAAAK